MIQVIGRGLDIIEYLAKENNRICTLTEISTALGLNAGTCANIIKTFVERGYIEKVEGKVGYRVGYMFEKLSAINNLKNRLVEVSKAELESLTKKYNENTLLAVLNGNTRQALIRINGNNRVQVITIAEREAFYTATGKLLIAMLSDKQLEEYIESFGYPKVHFESEEDETRANFFKEIEIIRKQGYVINVGDREVFGIAVPIYKADAVVASLSMYLPSFRCNKVLENNILTDLQKASKKISNLL
jgi:DNA-binding IclR family transcriptional regulator